MKKLILQGCLIFLSVMPSTLTAQIPINGLVAFYLFNGNANDGSGNKKNGTVFGPTLTLDRCSNPNSAYYFNGALQYISLPPDNLLLNEYTYSVWIKVSGFPANWDDGWMIFSPGSSNSGLCQGFSIHTLGEICGTSYNIGDNPPGCWAVTPPIETGKWFHLAYTRSYDILKIYINGVLMPYRHTDVYLPYPNNQPANYGSPDYNALIGCRSNFKEDDYFLGIIDDLYIYNRPLSNEEVLELFKSVCAVGTIEGMKEVCAGQENVTYSFPSIPGYTNYKWSYSGGNVNLNPDSDSILIDFSDSATSGNLSLEITGDGMDKITSQFSIVVNKLPAAAGIISGKAETCISETGTKYAVPVIPNATSYDWHYTGKGITISGGSHQVTMDFSANVTNGQLTVSGVNSCGIGTPSPSFDISVNSPPSNSGSIIGLNEVCNNTGEVPFSVPEIDNATSYIWNYSGNGIHIQGDSETVKIFFFNDATSGNLSVYGMNRCGQGNPSDPLPIIVKSCTENPETLNIPNSFSPNGDGINDYFVIRGLLSNSKLVIFDRSGKKCYESDDYQNNWNGKDDKGKIMESDTYWYVYINPGIQNEFKGFVYLKK